MPLTESLRPCSQNLWCQPTKQPISILSVYFQGTELPGRFLLLSQEKSLHISRGICQLLPSMSKQAVGNPNLHSPRSEITQRLRLATQQDHPHTHLVWNRQPPTAPDAFVLVARLSPRDRNLVFHPWTAHSKQTELG